MKRLFSILCVSAIVGAFGMACSDGAEPVTPQIEHQIAAETDEPGTEVSEEAAIHTQWQQLQPIERTFTLNDDHI